MIEVGAKTAITDAHNVIISAEHFSARQISHLLEEMGPLQTMTVRKAELLDFKDLERLCLHFSAVKITFDFS
jgi:hypothetical protein